MDEPRRRFGGVQGRGSVDQLIRTVQQHHANLSVLADTKAGLVITISSITLTIALTRTTLPELRIGMVVLSISCLLALFLAIYAVLPKFTSNPALRRLDPLFFGNFGAMTEEEFFDEMERVLTDDADLYETALRSIYQHGTYLYRQKYRFVRYAYIALLAGFIAASLAQATVFLVQF